MCFLIRAKNQLDISNRHKISSWTKSTMADLRLLGSSSWIPMQVSYSRKVTSIPNLTHSRWLTFPTTIQENLLMCKVLVNHYSYAQMVILQDIARRLGYRTKKGALRHQVRKPLTHSLNCSRTTQMTIALSSKSVT